MGGTVIPSHNDNPGMPLVLVDGKCMLAKAAFALPSAIRSPAGEPVNGVLGFGLMQLKLVESFPGSAFAVVFDRGEDSFRNEILPSYKSGRPTLPDGFDRQLALSKIWSGLLDFSVIETPKTFEADDVLATIAERCRNHNQPCSIVTSDKDLLQVIHDPYVRVLLSRKGVSDFETVDESVLWLRFGVTPEQYVHFRALTGDPSDAIDGVPKIGPATAKKLIQQFGDVDTLISSVEQLHGAVGSRVRDHVQTLRRNLSLLRVVTVPNLQAETHALNVATWSLPKIDSFASQAGLPSLFRRVSQIVERQQQPGLTPSSLN